MQIMLSSMKIMEPMIPLTRSTAAPFLLIIRSSIFINIQTHIILLSAQVQEILVGETQVSEAVHGLLIQIPGHAPVHGPGAHGVSVSLLFSGR
jgi:hypothetical protein